MSAVECSTWDRRRRDRTYAGGARVLRIGEEPLGEAVILHVEGDLDEHTAPSLRERIDALIEERGVRQLVVDVRDLSFIDSSGLGVLLGRFRRLQQLGGRMALVRPSPRIRAILELAGVPRLIPIFASARQATGR